MLTDIEIFTLTSVAAVIIMLFVPKTDIHRIFHNPLIILISLICMIFVIMKEPKVGILVSIVVLITLLISRTMNSSLESYVNEMPLKMFDKSLSGESGIVIGYSKNGLTSVEEAHGSSFTGGFLMEGTLKPVIKNSFDLSDQFTKAQDQISKEQVKEKSIKSDTGMTEEVELFDSIPMLPNNGLCTVPCKSITVTEQDEASLTSKNDKDLDEKQDQEKINEIAKQEIENINERQLKKLSSNEESCVIKTIRHQYNKNIPVGIDEFNNRTHHSF